jgi:hypothetical protein
MQLRHQDERAPQMWCPLHFTGNADRRGALWRRQRFFIRSGTEDRDENPRKSNARRGLDAHDGNDASWAQGDQNLPATTLEKPAAVPDSNGTGTVPNKADPEAAENQPLMATGVDLNGPPKRFSAKQTPE